ncbi:hypothetical protein AUJ10_02275 [Candidatus Pacearchaeota archaeon CG1_02_31_27]|nr:MAG: hypothetical protein AUJ10_02275 [Candidatus Pacearchaeota archaeon CG1_02_31_27]
MFSFLGNEKLLYLFDKHNIKSTFFITGFFAENEKLQVKEIAKKHEIASHGYSHDYWKNKKLDIEKDIKKSKEILEKISGKRIIGFRSPQMQFSEQLIKSLEKLNFKYDSSLHPSFIPGKYSNQNLPIKPFKPFNYEIIEFPAAVFPTTRLPVSWTVFRNMPSAWINSAVKGLLKREINPVIYIHSWEFIKFKRRGVPFYVTAQTGNKFYRKLENFIKYWENKGQEFCPLQQLI